MKEKLDQPKELVENEWESELSDWQRQQFEGLSEEAIGVLKRYPYLQKTFFGGQWSEVAGVDNSFVGLIDQLYDFIAEEEGGPEKANKIKQELINHRKKKLKI